MSTPFEIPTGTKQGGILSPDFFSMYMHDLITELKEYNFASHVYSLLTTLCSYRLHGVVYKNFLTYASHTVKDSVSTLMLKNQK